MPTPPTRRAPAAWPARCGTAACGAGPRSAVTAGRARGDPASGPSDRAGRMSIEIRNESGCRVDEPALAALARHVLDEMRIHPLAELSVLLVDAPTITDLHQRWMGEEGPTDVLSFPMDELRTPPPGGDRAMRAGSAGGDSGPATVLGDIVLCPEVATAQRSGTAWSGTAWSRTAWSRTAWSRTGRRACNPDDAMAWLFAAALALALAAGLCASAEIALFRMVRAGGRERGRDGTNGDSPPLQAILAEPRRYLSVLLAIRMGTETATVVLATAALVKLLGTGWHTFLIALAGATVVLYVVAGIWPVALGRHYDRQLAGAAARLLVPTVRALGPLPRLLTAAGNALTPGRGGREVPAESEEDLRGLVDLLEEHRVIEPGERAMIHSVFELGDTIVREVMVPRTDIVFAERDKNVRQVLSLALRSGFSRIPVVGENKDDVIGIAYLKDLVARSREHPEAETVEKVESVMRPATFVPESKPASALLREMQARQIHLAIVIDEYGGTAGLVTIEDILEEIVGEITDDYDQEQHPVEWIEEGRRARVTARLPVEELEELFDVRIDAEDVETVGGLLAQRLGRVPIAGSMATVQGLKLTAESLAGRRNRIGTVTVLRSGPAEPAS